MRCVAVVAHRARAMFGAEMGAKLEGQLITAHLHIALDDSFRTHVPIMATCVNTTDSHHHSRRHSAETEAVCVGALCFVHQTK